MPACCVTPARCAIATFAFESVKGNVWFCQKDDKSPVHVSGTLNFPKFKDSKHGFHVHEFGDLSDGCKSAGAHFNPFHQVHGGLDTSIRHVGDFGNIKTDAHGVSSIKMSLPENVTLFGDSSIIGRALVVHEKEDDLGKGGDEESTKTGNAGPRIACSVIGIADNKSPNCCLDK